MQTTHELDAMTGISSLPGLLQRVNQILYSGTWNGHEIRMTSLHGSVESITEQTADSLLVEDAGWMSRIHPRDQAMVRSAIEESLEQGGRGQVEYRLRNPSGTERFLVDHFQVIPFSEGGARIEGILVDQTDWMKARQQLERTRLLQNMGQLAAGIVHEINTPIQFIGDNLQFLLESFDRIGDLMKLYRQSIPDAQTTSISPERIRQIAEAVATSDFDFLQQEIPQAIRQSVDGIRHVSAIVTAMRDFSHIDERRMAPADINKAIGNTLIIVHHQLKYVARVETDLDPDLPMAMCCIDDLNQVLINLLINAAHAIGDVVGNAANGKGTIRVETRREDPFVRISISDTGSGIPEHVQARMFEPFFTTKGHDKGTGQGLLYVRTVVVEKHHGTLTWDTRIGRGTTFTVRIPIEQKARKSNESGKTNPVC